MQAHAGRTMEGLDRLRQLVRRLHDSDLALPVGVDGWTVSSTLAHLAFWDNVVVERWKQFDRRGAFTDMAEPVFDIVNAAALEQRRALPRRPPIRRLPQPKRLPPGLPVCQPQRSRRPWPLDVTSWWIGRFTGRRTCEKSTVP